MRLTLNENKLSVRLLLLAAASGLTAGGAALLYRLALSGAESLRTAAVDFVKAHGPVMIVGWFCMLTAIAFLVRALLDFEPLISGSGIPQFEGEATGKLHARWLHVLLAKAAGGILCTFSGLSLGREGPSVQLGAMAAKGVARTGEVGRTHQHLLITCGAGAGLAAAFNAPLAGVLFVLEEVHKTFSSAMLISVMVAATVADCLSKAVFGDAPVFSFPLTTCISLSGYWMVVLLGVLTGALGALYNRATLGALHTFDRVPPRIRILFPFAAAGILGFFLPQVLGGGQRMMELLYHEPLALSVLLFLLVAKFLFSLLSFATGAPGGIFLPLLVLGAYFGSAFSLLMTRLFGADTLLLNNFIVLAMLGLFVGIVRAPITGIVLIVEMTGAFSHLPSLTLVASLSYLVATAMGSEPIYDSLLARILKKRPAALRQTEVSSCPN